MKVFSTFCLISVWLLISCAEKKPVDRLNDEQLHAYADELAHKYIIIDGHIDFPTLLIENIQAKKAGFACCAHRHGI